MNVNKNYSVEVCRRLVDHVAIVTGGGHGLGKAYVERLAREGANVIATDIDQEGAESVAAEISANCQGSSQIIGLKADVTSAESLQRMVEKVMQEYGRIDVLVNNAALYATIPISRLPFDEISVEEWDQLMAVNLKGVWLASRAIVPIMKKQKSGKIINISSGTAFKGRSGLIHYVTSKAGILGFTRTLAHELGPFGINVNCVAPGNTLSEDQPTEEIKKQRQRAVNSRALQRLQTPGDLVGALAFFASGDSDFITGQTLVVDGGAFMH